MQTFTGLQPFAVAFVIVAAFAAAPADAQCRDRRTGVDSCSSITYDACSCGATNAGADPCNWATDGFCDAGLCQSAGFTFSAESPSDCPVPACSDGFCEFGEDATTCPADCFCGNGVCEFSENATSCPMDCGFVSTCNGDGICDPTEDPAFCADCGGGQLGITSRTCVPASNGPPKSFADASGSGAAVEVCGGTTCKTSQLSTAVVDKNCNPISGVNVNWRVVSGGGTITKNGNGKTDSFGVASSTWHVGTVAGNLVFEATAGGVSNSPETFSVFAIAGPATRAAISGLPNPVIAGVPQTFTVTMRDAFNNVATGYEGTIQLSSSDPAATATLNGTASSLPIATSFFFTDGGVRVFDRVIAFHTPGAQTLTAFDVGNPAVTTTSNLTVDRRLLSASSGDAQTGVVAGALSAPLSVRYTRADGVTPIAGAVITFAAPGGGLLAATTATTNAQGIASTTATLGTLAGTQRFTATVDGLVATFTALAVAGPAASLRLTSTAPTTTAGDAIDLTLLARDAFGNIATTYTGSVAFTSTDAAASLPRR